VASNRSPAQVFFSFSASRRRNLGRALFILPALVAIFFLGLVETVWAADLPKIRVGALQYGTVNWELNVIKHLNLAKKEGIELEVVPLASKNAAAVALQGGAVDVIVTDWFWVSRQRSSGRNYVFAPHSIIAGGLMARNDSGIESIDDLTGKKIGIAGGPVDKSWLLLRAYSLNTRGKDLADIAEPTYGAPPLLNKLIEKNEFPAVLTFWHYQARLKSKGLKQIIAIDDVLRELGVTTEVPIVGWVFREDWAMENRSTIDGFLRASLAAKKVLANSDEEWVRLESIIKPGDEETLIALREGYRAGIPGTFGEAEIHSAESLYSLLGKLGGRDLVGDSTTLAPGTFWTGSIN